MIAMIEGALAADALNTAALSGTAPEAWEGTAERPSPLMRILVGLAAFVVVAGTAFLLVQL
ncbi:hypothetical protein E3E12_08735 [Formicincola oecophyllae]|uniref:Uncharacterized protein n=1 Tax=Formicincola oecophyllae TaxID=2558361 RepID=A0A5B9M752_9PROT|nr:hypothetical protein [Formicincola oecophyllae]QEF95966.1 hypothetical protein E3E12_08735 [Formicincola oecophyllae]